MAVATVQKTTLYICMAVSLLIGFVGGVMYSAYHIPTPSPQVQTEQNKQEEIASLEFKTQQNPDDVGAWIQLGHAYFDSDQFQKAIAAYEKVLKLTPGDTSVMTDLGIMYRRAHQPEQAIALFDQVLQLEPDHPQAQFNKGVVLFNDVKDKQAALSEWKKLVQRNPQAQTPSGSLVKDLITQLERQN
ncbi:MAG: hypothetical protein CSB34_05765 [Desulfobulbus propionicus]|nr:MAG: hypothetical protein CSB34_05765 [Desulfobulbus propionicus]